MTEPSVVSIEAIQPDLSKFGQHVYKLMISRGVIHFNALAERMSTNDYPIKRFAVMRYVKGQSDVPPRFGRRLTEVLELNKEEELELSRMLYKWG